MAGRRNNVPRHLDPNVKHPQSRDTGESDPHIASIARQTFVRGLVWPEGRIQTCITSETGVTKSLGAFLKQEKT